MQCSLRKVPIRDEQRRAIRERVNYIVILINFERFTLTPSPSARAGEGSQESPQSVSFLSEADILACR